MKSYATIMGMALFAIASSGLVVASKIQLFDPSELPLEYRPSAKEVANMGTINKFTDADLGIHRYTREVPPVATRISLYSSNCTSEGHTFNPKATEFHYPKAMIEHSNCFDANRRTIVIVPGFMSSSKNDWMDQLKDQWLKLLDVNVVLVDWSEGNHGAYTNAVAKVPLVARSLTILLHHLAAWSGKHYLKDSEFLYNVHMVGHSLGAHISGYVGKDLGGKLGRITALDPAGPSFDRFNYTMRLSPTDAELVDVIHTNAGKMKYMNAMSAGIVHGIDIAAQKIPYGKSWTQAIANEYSGEGNTAWFGIDMQVGHVDFYANNGKTQPGCSGLIHICDHGRAYEILADVLNYELAIEEHFRNADRKSRWLLRKANRLIGFKSATSETGNNSEVASVGQSIFKTCKPQQMVAKTSSTNQMSFPTEQECSMPIDMLQDPRELRRELESQYKLNFRAIVEQTVNSNAKANADKTGQAQPEVVNNKYYFKTRHESPLVADHYVMAIRLKESITWHNSCSLLSTIVMNNEKNTTVELIKDFEVYTDHQNSSSSLIVVPFVSSLGPQGRILLETIRDDYKALIAQDKPLSESDQKQARQRIVDNMAKLMPKYVEIDVKKAPATTVFGTINKLWDTTKSWATCGLRIQQVTILPVYWFAKNRPLGSLVAYMEAVTSLEFADQPNKYTFANDLYSNSNSNSSLSSNFKIKPQDIELSMMKTQNSYLKPTVVLLSDQDEHSRMQLISESMQTNILDI